jgi:hypothetical protein
MPDRAKAASPQHLVHLVQSKGCEPGFTQSGGPLCSRPDSLRIFAVKFSRRTQELKDQYHGGGRDCSDVSQGLQDRQSGQILRDAQKRKEHGRGEVEPGLAEPLRQRLVNQSAARLARSAQAALRARRTAAGSPSMTCR